MQVQQIIGAASAATGLSDFGDAAALDALERLIKASNEEARLSPMGAQRWMGNLIGIAINRLKIIDYLKRHPQLLERPVEKPMFVFGLPRTGTTLTINLLSADPGRRCPPAGARQWRRRFARPLRSGGAKARRGDGDQRREPRHDRQRGASDQRRRADGAR